MQSNQELKITSDQAIWLLVGFDSVLILAAFALGDSVGSAMLATVAGVVLGAVAALFYMRPRKWSGPTLDALPQAERASEQQEVTTAQRASQQTSKPASKPVMKVGSARSASVLDVW